MAPPGGFNAKGALSLIKGLGEVSTPPPKKGKRAVDDEPRSSEKAEAAKKTRREPSELGMQLVKVDAVEEQSPVWSPAEVELLGDQNLWSGPRHGAYAWMDESIAQRAVLRDQRLSDFEEHLANAMKERQSGKELLLGIVGVACQCETILVGRIVCEGLEGKLNEKSVLLEGSNRARVFLSLSECPRLALFPGQLVAVVGRSGMAGSTFHAYDLLPGLPVSPPRSLPSETALHLAILAGPYCLRHELDYQVLDTTLAAVAASRPQVLIMLGPFLDANNSKVASGEPIFAGDQEPSTFEFILGNKILPMLVKRLQPLCTASPATQVLVIPSLDEVLCFHPLPQPPLDIMLGARPARPGTPMDQLVNLGVRFLPNPAHLSINGIKVSLTSADALSPVMRELVVRSAGVRLEEAQRLLLQQRCLFPVIPRDPSRVSERRAAALDFPAREAPDLCIFPSSSGPAGASVVAGTGFVNPGYVCRPAALGSYATVKVLSPGLGAAPLSGRFLVEVQKVS